MGCKNHQSIRVVRETYKRALKCEVQDMRVLLPVMEVLFSNVHFYTQQLMHCFSSFCNRQSLKIWPAAIWKTSIRSHLVDVKLIVRATKPLAICMCRRVGKECFIQSLLMNAALYMLLYCGHLSNIVYISFHFMTKREKMHYGHRTKEAEVVSVTSSENLCFAP